VVLGLFFASLNAGAKSLQAWLAKPLLDEVLVPAASVHEGDTSSARWLSRLALSQGGASPEAVATDGTSPPSAREPASDDAAKDRLRRTILASLWRIALLGLVIVIALPISEFGKGFLTEYVLGRVLVDVQHAVCAKLLTLPLRFHLDTTRGDTLSRTLNDVGRAHRALDVLFGDVLPACAALAIGGVVLVGISWKLTLVALCIAPPLVGVIGVFGRRIRKTARRRQERLGDVTQRLVEILAGIKLIKAFRAESTEEASFTRENERLFRSSMRVVKNRVLSKSLIELLNNAAVTALPLVGAWLVMGGSWGLSVGDLVAFGAVLGMTYAPTRGLTKGWTELMDAVPAAERFLDLLDAAPETPDPTDAVRIDGVRRGIRFEKVSFSYGREAVLRDVSLEVEAGQVVAIVGRTGAGKTTLVDLLLRFYDPDSGAIEIDGVDLRRIARDSLLDHVAVVSQEPFLFGGTIRDNIAYGRRGASEAEILAAARAAHVDEFVSALPEGYETQVGDVGLKLSGGQRQRITIARAILRNPAILIFDEATSALDAKSERYVQHAIDSLLGGRTVFVIAHRLSTIRHADKIVLLEGGTVSRVGTHDELMASDNLYRDLVRMQTQDAG
jgi:subfamily B ATP-binding cassette protein MsbA